MTQDPTTVARQAAYRRLVLAILALDVPTLATQLRARRGAPTCLPQVLPRAAHRAA